MFPCSCYVIVLFLARSTTSVCVHGVCTHGGVHVAVMEDGARVLMTVTRRAAEREAGARWKSRVAQQQLIIDPLNGLVLPLSRPVPEARRKVAPAGRRQLRAWLMVTSILYCNGVCTFGLASVEYRHRCALIGLLAPGLYTPRAHGITARAKYMYKAVFISHQIRPEPN